MPSTAGETFYDLALRALDEQQSEVAGLRTRAGTILAAAAVVATLLARPVFAEPVPDSLLFRLAAVTGVVGLMVVLAASVQLLQTHMVGFAVDVRTVYATADLRDAEALLVRLALTLERRRERNAPTVERLRAACGVALAGLVVATVGFGIGAALGFAT
ncbi:MAG TPA: hypothetical protein VN238_02625 [Solirubrobacteraceae bacterium]|nr:hypothetical protein [Solirubrobacteraceae bacterium]